MHLCSLNPRLCIPLHQTPIRPKLTNVRLVSTHPRRDLRAFCSATSGPATAREAVEKGLNILQDQKDAVKALALFQQALDLSPDEEETMAAIYNSACCYTRLKRFPEAAEAVKSAVNSHGLKLSIALEVLDCEQGKIVTLVHSQSLAMSNAILLVAEGFA